MNSYLKTYQIKLTALSPLHIGSGEKIGKKEYIYEKRNGVLYYPDLRKMMDEFKSKGLMEKYERFLLGGFGELHRFLTDNRVDYGAWRGEPLSVPVAADEDTRVFNEINTFMKDAYGLPYLPGSSIKGAFRTVILNEEAQLSGKRFNLPKPDDRGRYHSSPKEAKDIENDLLYILNRQEKKKSDAVNDVMAAFRFSDSEPLPRNALTICRKIDAPTLKSRNSEPKKLPTFRECLKPETEIKFTLTVDTALLKGTHYADLFENSGAGFMEKLKEFNAAYEREFLTHFDEVSPYYDNAIYLGGGAGFLTKTVLLGAADNPERLNFIADYLNKRFYKHKHLEDKRLGVSPHTLKITEYMGKYYEIGKCTVDIMEM